MCSSDLDFGKNIAEGLFQFILGVGADGEGLVHGLAEPLDGIGRAGAEDFRIRFHREELREREVAFLES